MRGQLQPVGDPLQLFGRQVIAPLIRLPFMRKQFVPLIKEAMVMPHRRAVDAA